MNRSTIAALDIGSSKVCCIIARVTRDKKIHIVSYGYNASKGIKNGVISNLNDATVSVCKAVDAAEQMAGERIDSVIVNVSGDKTSSRLQNSVITLKKNRPINAEDISKVLEKGLFKVNAENNELVHCLPIKYKIDGGEDTKNPINIYGEELSLDILLGMYPNMLYRNIVSVVEASHLTIDSRVFSAYASGMACLVEDEKEYGATIVDIGGGTTSIATFKNGCPIAFSSIPVGGINITNDIAMGLTTSFEHAEDLKNRQGCAFLVGHDDYANINIYPLGEEDDSSIRQMSRSDLIKIIAPRVEEILELVDKKLTQHGLKNHKNHRVVLTGGCSQLPGIRNVASIILDKQVRLGNPRNIPGVPEIINNPTFSTALGMLMFATNNMERKPRKIVNHAGNDENRIMRIINWFKQNS